MNTSQAFVQSLRIWNPATRTYAMYFVVRAAKADVGYLGFSALSMVAACDGDERRYADAVEAHRVADAYNEGPDQECESASWNSVTCCWDEAYGRNDARRGRDPDREDFHADL